jgi:uroporphyrinogen decarboxylase
MNGKQRIINAVNHKISDRLPSDLWADPIVANQLEQHFNVQSLNSVRIALGNDIVYVDPVNLFVPKPADENNVVYDEWGVGRRYVANKYGGYSDLAISPLANFVSVKEVEEYSWPSPDEYDYSVMAAQCDELSEYSIQGGRGHFFCPGSDLRGYENLFIDIIEDSNIGHAIMEKMTDYWLRYTENCIIASQEKIDILHLADDYSSQLGLMISPQSWRNFFRPYLKRMVDLGKKHNMIIFFHSCGAVRQLIPDLIDLGIDILNPIQIRAAGMNPEVLVKEYGRDLCFHGGVDLQHTLPYGSVDDVKNEVKYLSDTLGKYGGYILAPGHTIQPDTPLQNVLAIYSK